MINNTVNTLKQIFEMLINKDLATDVKTLDSKNFSNIETNMV